MDDPAYHLHATAIVGCGISLFFCFLSMVAFLFFRPKAESMLIKKHLTIALSATQVIFLISMQGYKSRVGCRILSVLMHFTASACFTWCALDALGLYFFHANTSPVIRNTRVYLITGWGVPLVVVMLTLLIGFLDTTTIKTISLYICWSSDNVIWTFVVSTIVIAMVNLMILIVILKQLRHPSYDISPKAAIEKRGTRYGLRTNSLLLLGLCLGWIFAILSFTDGNNLRYQLTFGLVNGLQGIFLFFFHCLLNSDHVKGYTNRSKRCLEESGRSPTSDSTRSKREEMQSGSSKRKGANRNSKLENVPLISVSNISKTDDKSESAADQKAQDSPPLIKTDNIYITEKDDVIRHEASISPDHDVIPQLPGTPDRPRIEHLELLSSKKIERRGDGNGRNKRPKTADNQLQVYTNRIDTEKRRKSSSEPTISSGQFDSTKGRERADKRIPGIQSEYIPDVKQKRSQRPHNSVNELESLFSGTECFTKRPHCSSLSSLPTREKRISNQERHRKSSSTSDARLTATNEESTSRSSPRKTQETIL